MNSLTMVLTASLFFLTVIPLSRSERWWVRVLDFPRLQIFLIAIAILLLILATTDFGLLVNQLLCGVVLLCIFYQGSWIIEYTPLASPEVKTAISEDHQATLSIITANVLMSNRNAEKILTIIENNDPDIVLVLESDDWWESKLDRLETKYPFTIKCPLDNLYGMHVYSRLALHNCEIEYLVEDQVPSMHAEIELLNSQRVRCHFLHPSPPVPEYSTSSSKRDAELIVVAKSLQNFQSPVIVAGDLNDVAWSVTTRLFRKISGLLDPRVGRGLFNTFNAKHWFIRWPLDHLFHSHHFELVDIQRLEKFGSDHFALFTKLVLTPKFPSHQKGLDADAEANAIAKEKLEAQSVKESDVPLDDT